MKFMQNCFYEPQQIVHRPQSMMCWATLYAIFYTFRAITLIMVEANLARWLHL
jgi:hypothetical protein